MAASRAQKLIEQAKEAAEVRAYQMDPDVVALYTERVRRISNLLIWTGIIMGLSFTAVNVQNFAAQGAQPWSLPWLAAWVLDPMVSLVVIGILLGEGVTSRWQIETGGWIRTAKWFALLSTYTMNTWSAWSEASSSRIFLHSVPPLLVLVSAEAGPKLRDRLTEAILVAARHARNAAAEAQQAAEQWKATTDPGVATPALSGQPPVSLPAPIQPSAAPTSPLPASPMSASPLPTLSLKTLARPAPVLGAEAPAATVRIQPDPVLAAAGGPRMNGVTANGVTVNGVTARTEPAWEDMPVTGGVTRPSPESAITPPVSVESLAHTAGHAGGGQDQRTPPATRSARPAHAASPQRQAAAATPKTTKSTTRAAARPDRGNQPVPRPVQARVVPDAGAPLPAPARPKPTRTRQTGVTDSVKRQPRVRAESPDGDA
jgi:hypothetical protein